MLRPEKYIEVLLDEIIKTIKIAVQEYTASTFRGECCPGCAEDEIFNQ